MKYLKKLKNSTKKSTSSIPTRMNILLGVIFILFALLIIQSGHLQLNYGSRFRAEVDTSDRNLVQANVPRGIMYDSKGRVLVGNESKNAITYTRGMNLTTKGMKEISDDLSQYISLDGDSATSQDLATYYLSDTRNYSDLLAKMPKEQTDATKLSSTQIYANAVKYYIGQKPQVTDKQKSASIILRKISAASMLSTVYVKNNNLTDKEVALVAEHLSELPGVNIGTDWTRVYPNGDSVQSVIGRVSSEQAGLPSDRLQYYLTQGYLRNDRVGTSYLERQYEPILRGTKALNQVNISSSDNTIEEINTVYPGSKGSSLTFTLDLQYQQMISDSLNKYYQKAQADGVTKYSAGAYAVATNPKTGAILGIAGIGRNPKTGETYSDALGTINHAFTMGSVIKGATVLGGLMNGAVTPQSNTLPEEAIYLRGTPVMKSVYPLGTFSALNAQTALEVSSNIYMMQLTLRWLKAGYVANDYITMPQDAFVQMRNIYSQFGLGVKTGIDLPSEVAGYPGRSFDTKGNLLSGSALALSFGNYDGYTVMQLAQYVSTIANGGYRMKPYLVKSIGQTTDDNKSFMTQHTNSPEVLNKIDFTSEQLQVVKEGFSQVVHGHNAWGTAHTLADIQPAVAGKTGTAQTFYYDPDNPGNPNAPETTTSSFVGYAPADDPQIAISVVFPDLDVNSQGHYNLDVAHEMFTNYFKLNPQK